MAQISNYNSKASFLILRDHKIIYKFTQTLISVGQRKVQFCAFL
jgi:hypothetical protein